METTPVLRKLRSLCLSLPETTERTTWGHPSFLAGKRHFVAFETVQGRPSIAFRLAQDDVARLLGRPQFFETPYGRGQWVSVWVDGPLDWALVNELLRRSYRTVALKRMLAAIGRPASAS